MAVTGDGVGESGVAVAASAISARRTVAAEVSEQGFVVAVRFLRDDVRRWDAYTLGRRAVDVADVAHDRYLANRPNHDGGQSYPSIESVADAERGLDF